ncbi:MAG: helix-turn-helix domain-containing protein [Planctomycetota bacterium]
MIAPWLGAGMPAAAIAQASGPAASTMEMKPEGDGAPSFVCKGDFTLDDIERETIVATLEHHNGHRQKSAKALGIGVRTLGLKLKKWKEQRLVAQGL